MILERAVIKVQEGQEEAFVAVFPAAREVILTAEGCISARLARGIESSSTFLLLVEWRTLEDHTEGFRGSPLFGQWREILSPYFAEAPDVEHFNPLA
ncbi:MAG: Antibiotic biosynthesis monooxygenase [Acidimicrobiaceae bacterium]|nr:Antibiotic biosynthesis monooxygenase [Acidimicrobiaceae bacterium]